MNRLKIYITSLMLAAATMNIGCVSTVSTHAKSAYNDITRSLQGKPGMSNPETDALYSQVKQEDQAAVQKLRHDLQITEETSILASLERKRDDLQRERSRINDKRIETLANEKSIRVELAKLEAIDRNQLGDKITNIEKIADTHVDALEIQQKRLQLDSEVGILDVKISKIQQEIDLQQNKIDGLNSNNDTASRG